MTVLLPPWRGFRRRHWPWLVLCCHLHKWEELLFAFAFELEVLDLNFFAFMCEHITAEGALRGTPQQAIQSDKKHHRTSKVTKLSRGKKVILDQDWVL